MAAMTTQVAAADMTDVMNNARGAHGRKLNRERIDGIFRLFHKMDLDGNGNITMNELRVLWKLMFPDLTAEILTREVERVFITIDMNQNQMISWEEMVQYLEGRNEADDEDGVVDLLYDEEDELLPAPTTMWEWAWALVEQSSTTTYSHAGLQKWALAIQVVMQAAILTSVTVMMIESQTIYVSCEPRDCLPGVCKCTQGNDALFTVEAVCIAIFSIEFCIRLIATPSQLSYWSSSWTWIDLVSILPFYLNVTGALPTDSGAESLVVLRVLKIARLSRVLRMLRLGKNLKSIQIMVVAIIRARIALVMMCVLMLMTIVFYSSLMYFVERRDSNFDPAPSPGYPNGKWVRNSTTLADHGRPIFFQSIPDTMWWGLATVTTVGYGDVYPITPEGKFIASLTMVTGILVVSYPITILTNAFATVNEEFREEDSRKRRRDEFKLRLFAAANGDEPEGQIGALTGVSGATLGRGSSYTRYGKMGGSMQMSPRHRRRSQTLKNARTGWDDRQAASGESPPSSNQLQPILRRLEAMEKQQERFQAEVLRRLELLGAGPLPHQMPMHPHEEVPLARSEGGGSEVDMLGLSGRRDERSELGRSGSVGPHV
eukprot:TRINITY_DN2385_c0_g1_i1.p1 TRINITY_DN2385_c0_g1~~TRINITY_DN2385_c0_g1_i1.p1  ORF type:complete len:601 (+),score=172.85 TRINITY_DN2385_c0_g1_i1:156-1958(+)